MMLKGILLAAVLMAVSASVVLPAVARGASGEKTLMLHAKDPGTWQIIEGGAAGRLIYDVDNGNFSFSAWGLGAETAYALVRHANDPAEGRILAQGVSGQEGALELSGSWQSWTMKICLVPASDLSIDGDQARLTDWHPERYLFEYKILGVPCDCDE
ncbi:hypothetical protein [Desulfuromonas sp. TF]|uniref:hypothetical protein n=1 Tax=Desulfuromonas sp. TF TaxID=1232410 RepID=UPI0004094B1E|nr:hypothetical protein [Desulfuromonas sp. TF]